MYRMFVLADEFKIPPWMHNDDGEVYTEDLSNIIALKYIQGEAIKKMQEKAALDAGIHK